jgi:hypothetical protein
MKKHLHLITLLLAFTGLSSTAHAQAPGWAWANDTAIAVGGMATDGVGNVYVANSLGDKFLVKFDNNGNELWERSSYGSQDSPPAIATYPNNIALDFAGNIFVSGFFTSDTMILGSTVFLRSAGPVDMFVAKFNNNGMFQWGRTIPVGNVGNVGYHLAPDMYGNIIVVGSYSAASLTIGTTTYTNPCMSGGGCPSMLVIKYDGSGNLLWSKSSFAGIGTSYCYSVATDAASEIYVGGDFLGRNAIVKYNVNGDTIWTQPNGGWYINLDASGNLYSGYDKTLQDGRVKRFNSATGANVWTSAATGNTSNKGISLMTDGTGNVYYAGTFRSTPITFGTTTLPHAGTGSDDDIFITKFDNAGNALWAKAIGNTGYDALLGVTTDISGNVFTGGVFFSPSLSFDADTLINSGQVAGIANIYFAKLGNNAITTGTNAIANADNTFSFYPNPANEELFVDLKNSKNATLEIFNISGQLIETIALENSTTMIKTNDLSKGMYLLKVKSPAGVSVHKLIKN